MKPSVLASLTVLLCACVVSSASGNALMQFYGLSWETGGFPDSQPGDQLAIVTVLDDMAAPLSWNPVANQYTLVVSGLESLGQGILDEQNVIVDYAAGDFGVFEDDLISGTMAIPGINPPNATSPSTYADGTAFLFGYFAAFSLQFNVVTHAGAFEGTAIFTGGSHFGELGNATQGFTFGGVFSAGAPAGYDLQWTGFVLLEPAAMAQSTWGGVKSQFRAALAAGD